MGRGAVLVDAGDLAPAALADRLRPAPGVTDVVVGAGSVLVFTDRPSELDRLLAPIGDDAAALAGRSPAPVVELPVVYDGPDLIEVAERLGTTPARIAELHAGGTYEVAFVGFAPGFGYLSGLPEPLHLPRRAEPRDRVPAGAVAIADRYSAVYPRATPGGWHLLGRTDTVLFDPDRDPPALLGAGTRVRFVPVDQLAERPPSPTPAPAAAAPVSGRASVEVLDAGPRTTVQDQGRPGRAGIGVPPSGAADRRAADLANRLVGNGPDAAVLETTLAGPALAVHLPSARLMAVAGAPGPVDVDGRAQSGDAPFDVRDGQIVRVGPPSAGLRRYLAVSGGFEPPATLGSRSTDTLTGLGPPVLRAGHTLPLGADHGRRPGVDLAPVRRPVVPAHLRIDPGPQHDWLSAEGAATLVGASWGVAVSSDRVAVRLGGAELQRTVTGELPSGGLVTGAIQLTPSGQLVVFGPDHPVTGGYPVVAVVDAADLPVAAQLRPGDEVRLVPR